MKKQKLNHQEILSNRADITGAEDKICDNCGEPFVFALQCGEHRFSLGLTTVLECLKVAEVNGHIPEIDPAWWVDIGNRYKLGLHLIRKSKNAHIQAPTRTGEIHEN